MTTTTRLALIIIAVASCNRQPKQNKEQVKAEIEHILQQQDDAYASDASDRAEKIAATCEDSIIFIGGEDGGMQTTSNGYKNDLADGYTKKPYDRFFRIYDNTVIVSSLHQAYKLFGKDTLYLNARSTKIFVKNGDTWKMAFVTNAPLPVYYSKPDYSHMQQFADYAGIYDNRSPAPDTIYFKEGKLFFGTDASPLTPIDDSTFLGTGYIGKTIFGRDAQGKVTHYTFEWPDGQRLRFNKL